MIDQNDYIDIPQSLGSKTQRSLTHPEDIIQRLCPNPPPLRSTKGHCFCFFDSKWLTQTRKILEAEGWSVERHWKKLSCTWLFHPEAGSTFLALLPWGAPSATCRMEELHAIGLKEFLVLGIGGRIQPDHPSGSLYLIDQAIRDEGTSLHYENKSIFAHPSFEYMDSIKKYLTEYKLDFSVGLSWTTDAPYRETIEKYTYWRKKLCFVVEMELSALFCLGKFRRFKIAALIVGADQLTEDGWIPTLNSSKTSQQKHGLSNFIRYLTSTHRNKL